MGILSKIFTWWDGATIGTLLDSARNGEHVGTDAQGNRYYRSKKRVAAGQPFAGSERRWVIYEGANDASRVPAEWHGWLHGSFDGVPESYLPPPRIWEKGEYECACCPGGNGSPTVRDSCLVVIS